MQHRVAVEPRGESRLEPGVYGNIVPGLGYLWIFPVGGDQYHIGVGGIGLARHGSLLERFYRDSSSRFSFTTLCSCEGSVRVASPYYSTPFHVCDTRGSRKVQVVVGVGESIGTVSPFTGEGIVFSMECAKMLSDAWPDYKRYTKSVLSRFSWMKKERETLDYLLVQKGNGGPRLRDRWRFYRNASRSGIGLPMIDAFKRIGTLSRWVDGPGQET
jgi:flavin-dependent dehydrogenase